MSALLLEEMSFHFYERPRQSLVLLVAIALENLGYRQLTAWWRLQAIVQWASRRKARWGTMERTAAWQQGKKD